MTLVCGDAIARLRHGRVPPRSDGHHIAARAMTCRRAAVNIDSALGEEPQQHIRDHGVGALTRGNCL